MQRTAAASAAAVRPCPLTGAHPRHAAPAIRTASASAAAGTATIATAAPTLAQAYDDLQKWLIEEKQLPPQGLELAERNDEFYGAQPACYAVADIGNGQRVCEIPDELAVTAVDAYDHPAVAPLAEGRGEITSLALWLMAERVNPNSKWAPLVRSLPEATLSPILWDDKFRSLELRGSPCLDQAREREAALRAQWAEVAQKLASVPDSPGKAKYTEDAFLRAACVVLAYALYLPAAKCFALVPLAGHARRTGNRDGCEVDFDVVKGRVAVVATQDVKAGAELMINDGRPNNERLLAAGVVQTPNASDYLLYQATLVTTDKLYSTKREVVQAAGFEESQTFPLYLDRFPIQLLAFIRLARVQDVGQLASVTFDTDNVVTPMNEYETLQLLMGDVRSRMQEYIENQEEDFKALQGGGLSPQLRLATQQRLSEKAILQSTVDAVRARLAPIRGIPTKSGALEDPNADLMEIFDTIEEGPKKLWGTFTRWASGTDDPELKPKKKGKR